MCRLIGIVYGGFIMIHMDANLFYQVNSKERNVRRDVNSSDVCIYSSFSIDYLKILRIGA